MNDDLLGAPNNLELGTLELIANDPVSASLVATIPSVTDFTAGLSEAESFFSAGASYFSEAATDLSAGDYVDASYLDYLGSLFDVASGQLLIEGVVASF